MLHVTDFLHYLYVAAPVSFGRNDCEAFKYFLEAQFSQQQTVIHSVNIVMRESLYGFQGNQQNPYLKITVSDPKYIARVRVTIEEGGANWKGMWKSGEGRIATYDMIAYVLRFMIDCKVSPYAIGTQGSLMNSDLRDVMGRSQSQVIHSHPSE